jgi:hypothetical protein
LTLILNGTDNSATTPAVTGTDTDTGVFFPAADTIAFSEGGVEVMRIDSLGNVGIGTASPANNGSGNTLLDIAAGSAKNANLYLHANNTSGASAGFQIQVASNLETYFWNYANSTIYFATNSTERARIPAAGGIQSATTISVGNATPSTSGAGITFPATQSASSNANTLDDYEEGTFTPSFADTTATYSSQSGWYTKVGNIVHFTLNLTTSALTRNGNNVNIVGLPFTVSGLPEYYASVSTFLQNGWNKAGATTYQNLADTNTTRISFYNYVISSGTNYVAIVYNDLQTTTNWVRVSGSYQVN